jgi:D-alanyl-D-alanine dipeptidase
MQPDVPLIDAAVMAVPLHDRGEPLIDVRDVAALRVDDRMASSHPTFARLRVTVVDRLVIAQSLLPRDLRLLVIEGYRPAGQQAEHFHRYATELRDANPEWTDEQLLAEVGRHCAPPDSAPHRTGAAVDLTLCTLAGAELQMGCRVHDGPVRSHGACDTDAAGLSDEVQANRALLGAALCGAGLVNLPTAWWHWSYGDQYWCHRTGAASAPYARVDAEAIISRYDDVR